MANRYQSDDRSRRERLRRGYDRQEEQFEWHGVPAFEDGGDQQAIRFAVEILRKQRRA